MLKHVDEFLKLMKVLTGDSRYDITFTLEEKKGEIRMCDVMEKAENIGIAKGKIEGIKGAVSILYKLGKTPDEVLYAIMNEYKLTEAEATEIIQ